jgi:predicted ester cyclase
MALCPSDIVFAFIDSVNQKHWEKIREIVSPSFVRHSRAGGDIHGVESLISFLKNEFVAFPDAKEVCLRHFASDNVVTTIMEFSGTQRGILGTLAATDIFVSAPYIAVYIIENSMIVESWAEWDNLSTLKTLGHIK